MASTTPTRDQLHELVDALPEDEIPAAARALVKLTDPFLRALAQAETLEPEELTPDEAAGVDAGLADVAAGRIVPEAEARRRLSGHLVGPSIGLSTRCDRRNGSINVRASASILPCDVSQRVGRVICGRCKDDISNGGSASVTGG